MEKPTEKQIEDFITFITQDHSWYKHLYVPYKFYIMMVEGCDDIKPIEAYNKNEEYINYRKKIYKEKYGTLYYLTDYYGNVDDIIIQLFNETESKFIIDNSIELDFDVMYSKEGKQKLLDYTNKIVEYFCSSGDF